MIDSQKKRIGWGTCATSFAHASGCAWFAVAWMLSGPSSPGLRAQGARAPAEEPLVKVLIASSPTATALRNTHRFEKAFLVRACHLSDAQLREVSELDDSWKVAMPKPENAMAGPPLSRDIAGPLFSGGAAGRRQARPENVVIQADVQPRTIETVVGEYRSSLRAKFSRILAPLQRPIYERELEARDEFRRQAAAEVLVAAMDKVLGLQLQQRQSLKKALVPSLHQGNINLFYYVRNEGILPALSEDLLDQYLNPEQLAIYRQARKADLRMPVTPDRRQQPFGE